MKHPQNGKKIYEASAHLIVGTFKEEKKYAHKESNHLGFISGTGGRKKGKKKGTARSSLKNDPACGILTRPCGGGLARRTSGGGN